MREQFEAMGGDERAWWGEFVRRVEGRPPGKAGGGGGMSKSGNGSGSGSAGGGGGGGVNLSVGDAGAPTAAAKAASGDGVSWPCGDPFAGYEWAECGSGRW